MVGFNSHWWPHGQGRTSPRCAAALCCTPPCSSATATRCANARPRGWEACCLATGQEVDLELPGLFRQCLSDSPGGWCAAFYLLGPRTGYLLPATCYLNAWYLLVATHYPVPGTCYMVPGTSLGATAYTNAGLPPTAWETDRPRPDLGAIQLLHTTASMMVVADSSQCPLYPIGYGKAPNCAPVVDSNSIIVYLYK